VSASDSFPGPHVSVTVRDRSTIAQRQLPVYVVALRGRSGRRRRSRHPLSIMLPRRAAQFQIPIVGSVSESTISLAVRPTASR